MLRVTISLYGKTIDKDKAKRLVYELANELDLGVGYISIGNLDPISVELRFDDLSQDSIDWINHIYGNDIDVILTPRSNGISMFLSVNAYDKQHATEQVTMKLNLNIPPSLLSKATLIYQSEENL